MIDVGLCWTGERWAAMTVDVEKEIEILSEASQRYYSGLDPFMSDEEFDSRRAGLHRFLDTRPDLFEPGSKGFSLLYETSVSLGAKIPFSKPVRHNIPMLSLQKIKTEDSLRTFIKKAMSSGAKSFRLQSKMDGMAVSVEYFFDENDREILYPKIVSTRGDGESGEDCSYILDESSRIHVVGIPKKIVRKDSSWSNSVELRGEILFFKDQYQAVNLERKSDGGGFFSNSRNAAAGILNRARKGLDYDVHMTFVAYTIIVDGNIADMDEDWAQSNSIVTALSATKKYTGDYVDNLDSVESVMSSIGRFREDMTNLPYDVDGVVVKPSNEAQMMQAMGSTSHHPLSQAAWKYPSEKAESTVRDIVLTVGRTGKITPVALFDRTLLEGSYVSRASLHNFSVLREKDVRVGSRIVFEKANMIIPQVVEVISSPEGSEKTPVPRKCPSCDSDLYYTGLEDGCTGWSEECGHLPPKTVVCKNTLCPSRSSVSLINAVSRSGLDIEGLGRSIVEAMVDSGILTKISDLYSLTVDDLSSLDVDGRILGKPRAEKIVSRIEESKNLPFSRILTSFGIPLIGSRTASDIARHFVTVDSLLQAQVEDYRLIPGIGDSKAESLYNGIRSVEKQIREMKAHGVKFGSPEEKSVSGSSDKIQGSSFSISGSVPSVFRNRKEFIEYIEDNGGVFDPTPSSSTKYMIGDPGGTSSKVKKALSLGIVFMSPEDFEKTFL